MHYLRQFPQAVVVTPTTVPVAVTADGNSTGVDLLQTDGQVIAVLATGARSGTSPTIAVKMQESDDNSTFVDIAGATFTTIGDVANQTQVISFLRNRRYVRANYDVSGTSPSYTLALLIFAQKKFNV